MDTLISILHIAGAVFIVGPMAILPMTAMRAVRAGNGSQVAVLAKSTTIFAWLSLLVFVFGFGAMSMAPDEFNLSVMTPWILWSIILYVIAFVLVLFVAVPSMKKAAEALGASSEAQTTSYPAIAAGSGLASLLLLAVVVLMVWKP
ncbi:DUF2269 family protein [Agromyces sp. NPDC055520]